MQSFYLEICALKSFCDEQGLLILKAWLQGIEFFMWLRLDALKCRNWWPSLDLNGNWTIFKLTLRSRKSTSFWDVSYVNFKFGWNSLRFLRNKLSYSSPCVHIKNMSSIYLSKLNGWNFYETEKWFYPWKYKRKVVKI